MRDYRLVCRAGACRRAAFARKTARRRAAALRRLQRSGLGRLVVARRPKADAAIHLEFYVRLHANRFALRSIHSALSVSMSATFLAREPALSCFSRAIALVTSRNSSK